MKPSAAACLLLATILLSDFACRSSATRIVVTFSTYNACAKWDGAWADVEAARCAGMSKCYGRRLVLGVANCHFDTGSSLGAAETWTRSVFAQDADSLAVERDAVLIASDIGSLGKVEGTLVHNDGIQSSMVVSSSGTEMQWDVAAVDQYNQVHALVQDAIDSYNASGLQLLPAMDSNDNVSGTQSYTGSVQNPANLEQWNLHYIKAPEQWESGHDGYGSVVAVLDTGLAASSLPMFAAGVISGYDFVSDPDMSNDGDGRDGNPLDPGDADADSCPSSSWHGTYVSSVVSSRCVLYP